MGGASAGFLVGAPPGRDGAVAGYAGKAIAGKARSYGGG
jgi:hypothetical protein